ncbi:unnamed protein product, partial [Effrenium voratum]
AASGDDDNAFPQVGHAADDELCSQLPTSPSRASGRATAAKSQSRPSSQTAAPGGGVDLQPAAPPSDIAAADPDPEPVKDELDEEQALEESAYEVLRRRRLMPGASTSDTDFAALFGQLREANSGFQAFPEEMQDNSDTILEITRIWTEAVRARFANMSDYLIRVCVGALAFARTRQADIHIREHAMVYWIAEGHRTLRFHSGDCYMKTPSGAFQQHRGVPPDQGRVQNFLMHVEGVFRKLPRRTERTVNSLLEGIQSIVDEFAGDEAAMLESTVNCCLAFQGDPSRRANRGAEEEEGADASQPWMLSTAKLIMIVKRQLTREITEDKLLHYMSEWCNTAKKQEASCCYEDCAIKYDDELLPAFQVPRADLENCYLRVPHCIKGTVPQHSVERLHKFYAQTFWCNVEVFKCCQAAQALAKRGLNVTRLFIGLSSGGVGQSLYSSHLQALYGHNFAYFDPNIWYHEEEMRKQVEQLNGCIILTGQETPATNRKLREDLFKKFASADGIAGRKPYGFCTKMIYTRGWKRLEANRMFRFSDVGKRDFNAILRRGFVWRFLARFEDPQVIESAYADIAKDGVFPKDPDLGDFLRSSAAVAAGLQLQHAFEAEHTKKECEEMIEQYAAMGGDGGLTEATMREACGLPPKDYRLAATRTAGVIILDAEQEDKSDDNWSAFRQGLLSFMLSRKMVTATPFALKPMKLQDGPNVTKDALLDGLTARKHCLKGPGKGKAEFAYIPLLTTGKSLGSIIDHTSRACELELPEAYAIEAFVEYVTACMHRREDAMILASVLKSAGSRRGRGRLAEQDKKLKETMLTKARKLEAAEEHAKQLLDRFPGQDRAAKRRRVVKSPDIKLEQGGGAASSAGIHSAVCSYHYTSPNSIRTRKQATGTCAQSFSRRAQKVLLSGTHDLDIQNSVFSLLSQLMEKLCLQPTVPQEVAEVMQTCGKARDSVCKSVLKMSKEEGKKALTAILYGGGAAPSLQGIEFVQKLQRASVYYKWIAVSTLTDEFLEFCDEASGKKNPESSILAHLYMACEDYVLTEWCKFLLTTYTPAHLSLHFDGVRISATAQASAAQICEQSEKHILETTGFSVKIREKKHLHVLEMLAAAAKTTSPPKFADDHKLRQAGNCIPHALACLGAASLEKVMAKLSQDSLPENVYMKETRGRTYKQSSVLCECELHPMLFLEKAPKGKWLLHLENGNSPHCVAVESLDASPAMVTVWDVNATFQMTDDAFLDALRCGADSSTVAFFLLSAPSESTVGSAAQLIDVEVGQMLDMAAGALGSVLGINVSSKEPVMVPDSDEEMQDVSLPAQHIACNPAADHGEFHWLDKDGMVTVDQILLNELAEEAARHLVVSSLQPFGGPLAEVKSIWPRLMLDSVNAGTNPARMTAQEQLLRGYIKDGSMSLHRAKNVISTADALTVWPTRVQFVEAVAALAREHSKDLPRKLEGTKLTIGKLLFNLTAADRAEWLFNNLRFRHFLPRNVQMLMPSGTTSNEALHAELNSWFRQVQQLHRSTLQLKLRVLFLGKLLAHNMALYHPTARQMPSAHVLARRLGQSLWTKDEWSEWAAQTREAKLKAPIRVQVAHEQAAIAASGLKRPAAEGKARKRTPFTLAWDRAGTKLGQTWNRAEKAGTELGQSRTGSELGQSLDRAEKAGTELGQSRAGSELGQSLDRAEKAGTELGQSWGRAGFLICTVWLLPLNTLGFKLGRLGRFAAVDVTQHSFLSRLEAPELQTAWQQPESGESATESFRFGRPRFYPLIILLYSQGQRKEYQGVVKAKDILAFLRRAKEPVSLLQNRSELRRLQRRLPGPLAIGCENVTSFQAAAQTLRGEMTFATGSKDLCSDLSETNPPVLYLRGERVKELTSDQDLVHWLRLQRPQVLQEITPDNSWTFLERPSPLVIYLADGKGTAAQGEVLFASIEERLETKYYQLAWADCKEFGDQFEVTDCPAILVIDPDTDEKLAHLSLTDLERPKRKAKSKASTAERLYAWLQKTTAESRKRMDKESLAKASAAPAQGEIGWTEDWMRQVHKALEQRNMSAEDEGYELRDAKGQILDFKAMSGNDLPKDRFPVRLQFHTEVAEEADASGFWEDWALDLDDLSAAFASFHARLQHMVVLRESFQEAYGMAMDFSSIEKVQQLHPEMRLLASSTSDVAEAAGKNLVQMLATSSLGWGG